MTSYDLLELPCSSELSLSLFYLTLLCHAGYIREGFVAVQHALDKAIMLYHGGRAAQKLFDGISVLIQRFPHPAYAEDRLIRILSGFLPLMFILMFSPTVLSTMRTLVSEKEKRLKVIPIII